MSIGFPRANGGFVKTGRVRGVAVAVSGAAVLGFALSALASSPSATATLLGSAINLRAADLPGFTVENASRSPTLSGGMVTGAKKCLPAALAHTHPGVATSPFFSSGRQVVLSTVIVQPSRALASLYLATARNRQVQRCTGLSGGITATNPGSPPVTVHVTGFADLPFAARGSDGTAGFREDMTITLGGVTLQMTADSRNFAVGRVVVSLFTYGIGQAFPAATEQRLTSVLLTRALAKLR